MKEFTGWLRVVHFDFLERTEFLVSFLVNNFKSSI